MDADPTLTGGMAVEQRAGQDKTDDTERKPGAMRPPSGWSARLATVAGPLLICGAVLLVLNAYAFRGLISIKQPDLLPFWFPTWCFLGKSLAAGHIPAWNPHVMGGVPFAADPQSGWGYVPAMALFSALPCAAAMRWIVVLNPLLAGLGLFAFLRSEGVSRAGATVGGLALALSLAGSGFVTYMPFAGMFAWTALLLAAASRLLRSSTWSARVVWLIAAALAWGQLGAAHLSDGLIVGTGALACFLAFRLGSEVRTRRRSGRQALSLVALVIVAFPLVNLAFFLPRLSYLPETPLALGYRTLRAQITQLVGRPQPLLGIGGYRPRFPLEFGVAGDVYLGAIALGLVFAGWRQRSLRRLWLTFAVFGLGSYTIGLHAVANAIAPHVSDSPIGSYYGHAVHRLTWGIPIAIAVLAAVGVDAWRERAGPGVRIGMVGPAVLAWGVLPLAFRVHRPLLLIVPMVVGLIVLTLVAVRPSLVLLIPLALAADLSVNGLTVKALPCCDERRQPALASQIEPIQPGDRPRVAASAYSRPGAIVRALRHGPPGRYVSIGGRVWDAGFRRAPANWPFMGTQRSMLFGLEEAQGYNPAQLDRYWRFVRAVQREPIVYNDAYFTRAGPLVLNLLQVAEVIQPSTGQPAVPGASPLATEGRFTLYVVPDRSPRASVISSWQIARSDLSALDSVLRPGFDPNAEAIVEKDPGLHAAATAGLGGTAPAEPPAGTAEYTGEGAQAAKVLVETASPALVLVRNAYERNWHATVDGRPAPVLPADSLIQAVPVGPGRHVVRLAYDDPTIGYGLLGSALSLVALAAAAALFAAKERRTPAAG